MYAPTHASTHPLTHPLAFPLTLSSSIIPLSYSPSSLTLSPFPFLLISANKPCGEIRVGCPSVCWLEPRRGSQPFPSTQRQNSSRGISPPLIPHSYIFIDAEIPSSPSQLSRLRFPSNKTLSLSLSFLLSVEDYRGPWIREPTCLQKTIFFAARYYDFRP